MSSQYGGPHDIPPQHMYPPPVPSQQQQQQPPHHDHQQHQHQHQQPRHYSNMPPPPPSYQHHYPPPQQMPPGGQQHQALPGQHGFHPRLEPAPHPRHQLPHQSMHNPQMMHQQGQMQHQGHPSSRPSGEGATLGQLTTYCLVDEAARRKYQLQVFQQPIRARMCGFGDKDRRPITPPPCVRLTILDLTTGREIDISEIDPLTFVLNVDLWDADGQKEVNLVRATGHSGVSSSNTAPNASSYPYDAAHGHYSSQQTPHHPPAPNREAGYNLSPQVSYPSDFSLQSGYAPPATQYSNPGYAPAQGYYPSPQYRQDAAPPPSPYNRTSSNASSTGYSAGGEPSRSGSTTSSHQGMSSRNLIGSLAVSAFRLTDNEGKLGIWFVLQDLSVRTEGQFRLRFSAVNVAKPNNAPRDGSNPQVNRGHVPMLASGFSDVFTVYSAKKFPGVCESTPLSKTFATQGVKIPIRKDGAAKGEDDDDE